MTSPQYDRLNDICQRLDSVSERLQRRLQQPAASPTDQYLNKRMAAIIMPLRGAVTDYRDFHQQHDDETGRIDRAQREAFFDMLATVSDIKNALLTLVDSTMCRTSTAPGSQQRLSEFFRRVVADERQELGQVHNDLRAVIEQDLAQLKRMPRHLRLLSTIG